MTTPRWIVGATLANALVALLLVAHVAPAAIANETTAPVLRGRALEIVDGQGRVRASIQVHPAGTHPATGAYPETVILRLIDANGRPEVKIVGSEHGAGLSFVGETDATQVMLAADGSQSVLKLVRGDGKQQVLRP